MAWKKMGKFFEATGQFDWMQTHTAFPVALELDDCLRVYFASRCKDRISRTSYIDVAKDDFTKVLKVEEKPLLDRGKPGTFDDCGVNPDCAVRHEDKVYLYYHGWTRCAPVPHRTTLGLAISEDGGNTFTRVSDGPLFDRGLDEPYFCTNPWVLKEQNLWHMWYMSVTGWDEIDGQYEGKTVIRYATSEDGIHWTRAQHDAIKPTEPLECVAGASVIKDEETYKMWYCYRSAKGFRTGEGGYRIGYAESKDAKNWTRHDSDAGITLSETGFDSKMQEYPCVFDLNGKRHMIYNGDGFGQSGIGYAIWES